MGGIKRIYAAIFDDVTAITLANDKVTGFTMATGKKFYKYEFRPETASLVSTPQINSANGSAYIQSVLSLQFAKQDTAKRLEMNALSLSDLRIVVEDNNGFLSLLGYNNPVVASGGESGTGQAFSDANGYGLQLTDNSLLYPYEVTADMSALL